MLQYNSENRDLTAPNELLLATFQKKIQRIIYTPFINNRIRLNYKLYSLRSHPRILSMIHDIAGHSLL